jgi:hypothetical protein
LQCGFVRSNFSFAISCFPQGLKPRIYSPRFGVAKATP